MNFIIPSDKVGKKIVILVKEILREVGWVIPKVIKGFVFLPR